MKRFLTATLILGLFAPVALVGCGEENKSSTEIKQKGPGGTTSEKITTETEQSGQNPPTPTGASGEPGPKTP